MLLDTHVLLWFVTDDAKLSASIKDQIEKAAIVTVSMATLWEIAIKLSVQKLSLGFSLAELPDFLIQLEIGILPISFADVEQYAILPLHHRDPFDRILIAQVLTNDLAIVSIDRPFDAYPIQRLWR